MTEKRDKTKGAAMALLPLIVGGGAGAAAMYLIDPRSGRRRRAVLRDKMRHTLKETSHLSDQAVRDLRHRASGAAAQAKGRMRHEEVSDDVLHERVRAALGRVCSHPGAIEVRCRDGEVELSGPILADEVKQVLRATARVRGVKDVTDSLEAHERADISALQGGTARTGPRGELRQEQWTPGLRLLAIVGGASVLLFGTLRRSGAAALFGSGMLLRALTNRPARQLVGLPSRGRNPVRLMKSLHIHAPREDVFTFFCHPENFPRFMSHVRDVEALDDGTYHWEVEGPAHAPFSWDATFEANEPHKVSWKSLPGSTVENEGQIRFEDDGESGTRAHIQMSYNPPAGALGHAFAKALGADPKQRMDDDLLRLKSLLENGRATGREGQVDIDEVAAGLHSPS